MSHRVLVVEDEPDLRALVEYNLREAGFEATGVGSAGEAQQAIEKQRPDLVVLDLMLPDLPGTEVCREIRRNEATRDIPVLMLTAKAEEANRVYGFEVGADDYVVKPASMRELVLRVQALLRRGHRADEIGEQPSTPAPAAEAALRIDQEAHQVEVEGHRLELTPLEMKLLSVLVSRAGRVQSREVLLSDVWDGDDSVSPRTVDMRIKRLRSRLGPAGDQIETVRGVGYRFRRELEP